jgi:hypothetical protein
MTATSETIYSYHADANALGGSIVQPFTRIIPSQAQVSLPAAGGFTSARTGAFNFEEIVSCSASYCFAAGSRDQLTGGWVTLVTAVVENFTLLGIVTAERIVSQLSIHHAATTVEDPTVFPPPRVTFAGAQYHNLRIAGFDVQPQFNLNLLIPTESPTGQPWRKNEGLLQAAREQHQLRMASTNTPDWVNRRYAASNEAIIKRGYVLASLVNGFEGTIPGKVYGNIVEIEEFGRFSFAEVSVHDDIFRLTMLRAELGCAVHGSVTMGTTSSNGGPIT